MLQHALYLRRKNKSYDHKIYATTCSLSSRRLQGKIEAMIYHMQTRSKVVC